METVWKPTLNPSEMTQEQLQHLQSLHVPEQPGAPRRGREAGWGVAEDIQPQGFPYHNTRSRSGRRPGATLMPPPPPPDLPNKKPVFSVAQTASVAGLSDTQAGKRKARSRSASVPRQRANWAEEMDQMDMMDTLAPYTAEEARPVNEAFHDEWNTALTRCIDMLMGRVSPPRDKSPSPTIPDTPQGFEDLYTKARAMGGAAGIIFSLIDNIEQKSDPDMKDDMFNVARLRYEFETGVQNVYGGISSQWCDAHTSATYRIPETYYHQPETAGIQQAVESLAASVDANMKTMIKRIATLETQVQGESRGRTLADSIHAPDTAQRSSSPQKTNKRQRGNKNQNKAEDKPTDTQINRPTEPDYPGPKSSDQQKSYAKAASNANTVQNQNNGWKTVQKKNTGTTGPKRDVHTSVNLQIARRNKVQHHLVFEVNPLPADNLRTQVMTYAKVREIFKAHNLKSSTLRAAHWNQRNKLVVDVDTSLDKTNVANLLMQSIQQTYQATVNNHTAVEGFQILIPAIPIYDHVHQVPFTPETLKNELHEMNAVFEEHPIVTPPRYLATPARMQELLKDVNSRCPIIVTVGKPMSAYNDFFVANHRLIQFYGLQRHVEEPRPRRRIPQCENCWAFYHTKSECTRRPRCLKCGMNTHTIESCQTVCPNCRNPTLCNHIARCGNCKGEHRMDDTKCPIRPKDQWVAPQK